MTINDFSSLIQLSATMSIAFVAVEYVKSYTSILCERFFKFQDFVEQSFKECRDILTDKETLNHICPIDIEGRSTNTAIEDAKRKNESLTKEIEYVEKAKKEEVSTSCQARSMSSLCFFVFLFNTLLLFFGGIENIMPQFTHIYSTIFCGLICIYVIIGWCIGKVEKPKRFCDFSSLRHSIYSFLIIALVSTIACLIIMNNNCFSIDIDSFWWYILIGSVLCSYMNFIIFVIKIGRKAVSFKENVNAAKDELKDKCKKAQREVEDLLATSRVSAKLKAD